MYCRHVNCLHCNKNPLTWSNVIRTNSGRCVTKGCSLLRKPAQWVKKQWWLCKTQMCSYQVQGTFKIVKSRPPRLILTMLQSNQGQLGSHVIFLLRKCFRTSVEDAPFQCLVIHQKTKDWGVTGVWSQKPYNPVRFGGRRVGARVPAICTSHWKCYLSLSDSWNVGWS